MKVWYLFDVGYSEIQSIINLKWRNVILLSIFWLFDIHSISKYEVYSIYDIPIIDLFWYHCAIIDYWYYSEKARLNRKQCWLIKWNIWHPWNIFLYYLWYIDWYRCDYSVFPLIWYRDDIIRRDLWFSFVVLVMIFSLLTPVDDIQIFCLMVMQYCYSLLLLCVSDDYYISTTLFWC